MGLPTETYSRYHGLSLDELRRALDEQAEPRGDYMDAHEEAQAYQAWRERQTLIRLLEALDGATLHENRGYLDFQRYSAGDVLCAFKKILADHDLERPL